MNALVPPLLAVATFAAFMLKSGELLASRKSGRSGGRHWSRGKAKAEKAARKGATAGAAPWPPEGGPPSRDPSGGGPSGPPGAGGPGRPIPAAWKPAAGSDADGDGRGSGRMRGGSGRAGEAGKDGRRAGRDGNGFGVADFGGEGEDFGENGDGDHFGGEGEDFDENGDGDHFGGEGEVDDGEEDEGGEVDGTEFSNLFFGDSDRDWEDGLPEFPEAPAWGFPTDSPILALFRNDAETCLEEPDSGPEDEADFWDILSSAAYVALGPDDPVRFAAMSRAALATAKSFFGLEEGAALAAGAAAGMCRTAVDAAGRPGTSRETFRRETKFALGVLAVSHERIRLLPGYSPEIPLPAPALRLPAARSPGTGPPAGPGPGELLAALETAEDGHGPGSREALAALSRLGEAVADEEALTDRPWPGWGAWKARAAGKAGEPGKAGGAKEAGEAGAADDSGKADVPAEAGESGKAGGPKEAGEASAEALLRSASAGLDALLGRTHPYSLDARELLARFLAGGSGPVLPLDPLPSELPAEGALREAMDMFLETAWERASKIPGARAATGGAEPGTPELLERLPAVLRLSRDRAAFAAAASAAECDMLTGDFRKGARSASRRRAGRRTTSWGTAPRRPSGSGRTMRASWPPGTWCPRRAKYCAAP